MSQRIKAGLLALFLGGLGAHKFYLGQWVWGLAYLLLCWTFVPAIVALIEAVYYFSLTDEAFEAGVGATQFTVDAGGIVLATPGSHVRCPDCRELVRKDARKCKHCGTALLPQ